MHGPFSLGGSWREVNGHLATSLPIPKLLLWVEGGLNLTILIVALRNVDALSETSLQQDSKDPQVLLMDVFPSQALKISIHQRKQISTPTVRSLQPPHTFRVEVCIFIALHLPPTEKGGHGDGSCGQSIPDTAGSVLNDTAPAPRVCQIVLFKLQSEVAKPTPDFRGSKLRWASEVLQAAFNISLEAVI